MIPFDIGVQPTDQSVAVYPLVPWGAGCAALPGLPIGAGAATGQYSAVAERMNAIAPFWGQPADAFDAYDWNNPQTVVDAGSLLLYALATECGVTDPADMQRVFRHIQEPGAWPVSAFVEDVRAVLAKWCPAQLATQDASTELVNSPEEKKTPWGWIAAGVGGLIVLGGVIYYVTRPTKRRNPTRRRRNAPSSSRRRQRRNPTVTWSGEQPTYAESFGGYGELLPIGSESGRQRAAGVLAKRQRRRAPAYTVTQTGEFDVEPRGRTVRKKNARKAAPKKKNARKAAPKKKANARKAPKKKTRRAAPRRRNRISPSRQSATR